MTNRTNTLARLAAAAGVTALLAFGSVTPSLADSNDGGAFNPEQGAVIQVAQHQRAARVHHRASRHSGAYRARAQVYSPRFITRRGARYDDPPGSAFQTRGESHDDVGCPC